MSKENRTDKHADLLAKLQQVRTLLDECMAELRGPRSGGRAGTPAPPVTGGARQFGDLDFEANQRAFIKEHAVHLSPGARFGLLLAYLAKGDVSKEVRLKDIETAWGRMTALLGDFNRKYSNDAKEQGLVTTKKQGAYVLRPKWREVLAKSKKASYVR